VLIAGAYSANRTLLTMIAVLINQEKALLPALMKNA